LVAEAKDQTDSFEDVPFDFRHQKVKKRWEFPAAWALTPERKKYLEESRRAKAEIEDRERENGRMVDGRKVIETSLPFVGTVAEPVMVEAGRGEPMA
jgi:small subunit ribosomal protein S35